MLPEQDPVAIMAAAVAQEKRDAAANRRARWAYVVSVLFFPLGLLLAAYYAFSGKPNGRHIALGCVLTTLITGAVLLLLFAVMVLSLPPDTLVQLQSVNVDDYKALLE